MRLMTLSICTLAFASAITMQSCSTDTELQEISKPTTLEGHRLKVDSTFVPSLQSDSLALVDIYNEAGGAGWFERKGWLKPTSVRNWKGVVVEHVNGVERVVELHLGYNNLRGTLSKSIGRLTALRKLKIGYNRRLKGSLPDELYNLKALEVLNTTQSAFTGELSPKIAQLTNLDTLCLRTSPWVLDASSWDRNPDVMTGSIPKELAQLKKIRYIDLGRQGFSGEIPKELGQMKSLTYLNLETCRLTGAIPKELGELNVQVLDLSHNKLTGEIPEGLFGLKKLRRLDLSSNRLTGAIPESIENLQYVFQIKLSNNRLSGRLPEGLGKLPRLTAIFLGNNQLEGELPANFAGEGNKALGYVDVHNNNLTGSLPKPMKHHRYYDSPYVKDWHTMSSYVEYYAEGNRFSGTLQAEYLPDKKRWHIYVPQQAGYGFDNLSDEDAEKYRPKVTATDLIHIPTDVD